MWKYIKFLLRDEGGWIIPVIIGGTMLYSAYKQSETAKKASKAQQEAAAAAAQAQLSMYYQTRADLAPWREAGKWALGEKARTTKPTRADFDFNAAEYKQMYPDVAGSPSASKDPQGHYGQFGKEEGRYPSLAAKKAIEGWTGPTEATGLIGKIEAGPGEYEESPYYNFLLEEGTRGLERGAAARGSQLSGAEGKALTAYGQNLASTDYGNWLSRYYQSLTPYQSMAGLGQTATMGTGAAGTSAAGGAANALLAGGQASAAGIMGAQQPYTNYMNWGANQLAAYYGYGGGGYGGGYGMGGATGGVGGAGGYASRNYLIEPTTARATY